MGKKCVGFNFFFAMMKSKIDVNCVQRDQRYIVLAISKRINVVYSTGLGLGAVTAPI